MNDLLLPAGLLLLGLAALQWRGARYVSYPPALYALTWGAGLLLVASSGSTYDPIGSTTVVIYVVGAVLFAVGGWLGWRAAEGGPIAPRAATLPEWTLPALTLVMIVLAPFYVLAIIRFVGQVSPAEFLFRLRVRTLEAHILGGLGVIANVVPYATMVALLAAALPARTELARSSRAIAIGLGVVLAILTGGRSAPLALIIGVLAVVAARRTSVPWRPVLLSLTAGLVVFGTMGVLVRKGTADPNADLRTNLVAIAEGVRHYAIGGVVAFDHLVEDPRAMPSNGGFKRTAREIANAFGARYEVPTLHLQFKGIGDRKETNVYTLYAAYLQEAGAAAMFAFVLLLGAVTGLVHRLAVRGSLTALLFHGILAGSVVQSVFAEAFLMNLNFLGKLGAFALALDALGWYNGLVRRRRGAVRAGAPVMAR